MRPGKGSSNSHTSDCSTDLQKIPARSSTHKNPPQMQSITNDCIISDECRTRNCLNLSQSPCQLSSPGARLKPRSFQRNLRSGGPMPIAIAVLLLLSAVHPLNAPSA